MSEKAEKDFNRIILVGNGFDLAAGLKTKFSDFFLDLIKELVLNDSKRVNYGFKILHSLNDTEAIIPEEDKIKIIDSSDISEIIKILSQRRLNISCHFSLLSELLYQTNTNWVNIESIYFKKVNQLFKRFETPGSQYLSLQELIEKVSELNSFMSQLEVDLTEYLIREQNIFESSKANSDLSDFIDIVFGLFASRKDADLIKDSIESLWHKQPKMVTFVNFNYTNILQSFLTNKTTFTSQCIHIHGSVNNSDNPIIFGYGDDTSDDYRELELFEENVLLEKVKSFQYPKTHNYHKLLGVLEDCKYEVFIFGHSCGLTDKTLLSTIFEHENCFSIKNFHHGGEQSDFKKRMAISRHFSDKKLMRKRLLPFDLQARFPSN